MRKGTKGIRGVQLAALLTVACGNPSPSYLTRWAAQPIDYADLRHPAAKARGRYGRSGIGR